MSVLAVYNSKGGVGKTSLSVNLAWTAAHSGARTLLWDLDPQAASSFTLQHNRGLGTSVEKLLSGKRDWVDRIVDTAHENLSLLPSDMALRNWDILLDDEKKSKKLLTEWLKPIRERFSVIVLDCPPGLTLLSENIFRAADCLLVPVIPAPLSLRTLSQIRQHFVAEERDESMIVPIVSMADLRKRVHKESVAELQKVQGTLQTVIPLMAEIERMGLVGTPSASRSGSRSWEVFQAIWGELSPRMRSKTA